MSAQNMKLKRVLGFTTNGQNSFITQPNTGNLIYVAGCVVIVFNSRLKTQNHLLSDSKQSITTLAITNDGRFLATADCGNKATIRIWDLTKMILVVEFAAHNLEVSCMCFSGHGNILVTVGSQNDMMLSIWDWQKKLPLASHKISTKISAISFSSDSSYFITVGQSYVKYWYIQIIASVSTNSDDSGGGDITAADIKSPSISSTSISISSRSAILGEQRKNNFCDVKCGRGPMSGSTFCITETGLLCELNQGRLLHKWVDLRTSSANCLVISDNLIVVGCANGVVRCFNTSELRFLKNLPKPHYLGRDITLRQSATQQGLTYPNIIGVGLDENINVISCVYNDRSIYVWDLSDSANIIKKYSALYHSSCIWGVDMYPNLITNPLLPDGSFITCSRDDTIRIWDPSVFGSQQLLSKKISSSFIETNDNNVYKENLFSDELLKIIFTDFTFKFLCDLDCSDKNNQNYDSNEGLRCLKISPDGRQLAIGSRSGTIKIFDFERDSELKNIAAHDAEVLCLEYSNPKRFDGFCYLASSSRDKLIHIFDATNDYTFLQTIDDHSSSITALRFVNNRSRDSLQLVSCGADQKIIFRNGIKVASGQLNFIGDQQIEGKNTFYDMEVDSESSCLMTACKDRMIRLFNVAKLKYQSGFKGSCSDEGTLIKIALDPSCTFLAASSTDKSINIYDYQRGECIASVTSGLSDLVTDMKFLHNGAYLVACSGDGCIFIWSSPAEIANAIEGNLDIGQLSLLSCSLSSINSNNKQLELEDNKSSVLMGKDGLGNMRSGQDDGIRLKSLPDWAKQQFLDEIDRNIKPNEVNSLSQVDKDSHLFEPGHKSVSDETIYDNLTPIDGKPNHRSSLSKKSTKTQSIKYKVQNAEANKIKSHDDDVHGEYTTSKSDILDRNDCNPIASNRIAGTSQNNLLNNEYYEKNKPADYGLIVGDKFKFFRSRENSDKISSREKFVTDSLVYKEDESAYTKRKLTSKSSLSGLFNTKLITTDEQNRLTNSSTIQVKADEGTQNESMISTKNKTKKQAVVNHHQYFIDRDQTLNTIDRELEKFKKSPELNKIGSYRQSDGDSKISNMSNRGRFQDHEADLTHQSNFKRNNNFDISQSSQVLNSDCACINSSSDDDDIFSAEGHEQETMQQPTTTTINGNLLNHSRPITPPKPSLHRQIRGRNLGISKLFVEICPKEKLEFDFDGNNDVQVSSDANYMTNTSLKNSSSVRTRSIGRKLYSGTSNSPATLAKASTMRSSKSECNLGSCSRYLEPEPSCLLSANALINCTTQLNPPPANKSNYIFCEKLDLAKLNPASVPLTQELCQYVVDELQALSKYATRLHQRLKASDNREFINMLARGVQNSMDILSIVPPRNLHQNRQHHHFQSQVNLSPVSMLSRKSRVQSQQARRLTGTGSLSANNSIQKSPAVYLSHTSTTFSGSGSGVRVGEDKTKSSDYQAFRDAHETSTGGQNSNSNSGSSSVAQQLKASGGCQPTKNNLSNIDKVLEAYSDRLFRMVQERMVEQQQQHEHQNQQNNASQRPNDPMNHRHRLSVGLDTATTTTTTTTATTTSTSTTLPK